MGKPMPEGHGKPEPTNEAYVAAKGRMMAFFANNGEADVDTNRPDKPTLPDGDFDRSGSNG